MNASMLFYRESPPFTLIPAASFQGAESTYLRGVGGGKFRSEDRSWREPAGWTNRYTSRNDQLYPSPSSCLRATAWKHFRHTRCRCNRNCVEVSIVILYWQYYIFLLRWVWTLLIIAFRHRPGDAVLDLPPRDGTRPDYKAVFGYLSPDMFLRAQREMVSYAPSLARHIQNFNYHPPNSTASYLTPPPLFYLLSACISNSFP